MTRLPGLVLGRPQVSKWTNIKSTEAGMGTQTDTGMVLGRPRAPKWGCFGDTNPQLLEAFMHHSFKQRGQKTTIQ